MLTALDLPKGASFDSSAGRFAWTPDASQAGRWEIAFTATSSSAASATGHMLIEVGSGKPFISSVRNAAGQDSTGSSPGAPATLTRSWLSAGQATASDPGGDSTNWPVPV
jgi:hypothetical protein